MSIMDDYLMIRDYHSPEKLVYFFDRHTFEYLGNFIPRGQGPGEVANIGHIAVDEAGNRLILNMNDSIQFGFIELRGENSEQ
jgi:hypothetical protein